MSSESIEGISDRVCNGLSDDPWTVFKVPTLLLKLYYVAIYWRKKSLIRVLVFEREIEYLEPLIKKKIGQQFLC